MADPRHIFVVALRRSGTTAMWRTMRQDPGHRCFDEPFSMLLGKLSANNHKNTWDEFLTLRDADPEAWAASFAPVPRAEEVTPELSPAQASYLRYLCSQGPTTLDETRIGTKVPALAEVAPEAVVVHLYRHPAAFVSSHMIASQNKEPFRQTLHKAAFFQRPIYFDSWGMEQLWKPPIRPATQALMDRTGVTAPGPLAPAVHKLMASWLAVWRSVEQDGPAHYGDRFVSLSFEDFCTDPRHHLAHIYDIAGRAAFQFNVTNLHAAQPGHKPNDPRWAKAARAIGFTEDEMARFFPGAQP